MVSQLPFSGSADLRQIGFLALLGAILLGVPATASAQYFGRNKVQYETFDFRILKTPHYDIHFYPEEGEAVEDAARMAERWYERLARIFQHEYDQPKPIILYADHADFQQTNTLSGVISEGTGGVTESLKNRVIMPLTGSYASSDHVLGHELVHSFQFNIAQGRAGAGIRGLTLLPLWLVEGMAEYLSVGRDDPLTGMWLRDAILRDDFPTLGQMTSERRFFPYRFGEALWAYVGGTYGDEAVIDLYRRSLRVGWGPALQQVLGMDSETLSTLWREKVEEEYLPLMAGRNDPAAAGAVILSPATGAGRQNVGPAVSPDGRSVAFLSEKDLTGIDLFIADARTGEVKKKLVSANSDPHFDALRFIDSAGDWSPDGTKMALTVFAEGDNEIAIVDVDSKDILQKKDFEGVGALTNPVWSPDGGSIVFSGMEGGVSDIFIWEMESDVVEKLTDDRFADMQPTWSPDGQTIAFVTDRGSATSFDDLMYGRMQIAFLDVATGNVQQLALFGTGAKHINPQYAPDGQSLYFISDQDGFSDIYQYTFASGDLRRITQLVTGVSGITGMAPAMSIARETGTLLFSVFDEFEFHIYSLDAASASAGGVQVAISDAPQPGRLLPPKDPLRGSRVTAYLGDPLTGLEPTGTYLVEDAVEYDSSLSLDYIGQPSIGIGTGTFGSYAAGGAAAFFSDILGNRTLGISMTANGTVKDIGGSAFYLNQEKRLNWGFQVGRTPFLQGFSRSGFDDQGRPFISTIRERTYVSQAGLIAAYPFSTTRRVEATVGATRFSFDTEEERFFLNQSGNFTGETETVGLDNRFKSLNLAEGSIALVGDNSLFGFTSPIDGSRFRLQVGATVGTEEFFTLTADYRKYIAAGRNFTVAFRALATGRYGNDFESESAQAITPFFIGWETFVRGYSFESFEGPDCIGDPIDSPSSGDLLGSACPGFDRLVGQRIGVANMEIRIPFLGTDRFGLINFPFLPTELVLFSDAGLAWDDIDDVNFTFEQRASGRVPVFSSGVSARVNILGFLVLEAYYAKPWQRPERGAHWGFLIAPGW